MGEDTLEQCQCCPETVDTDVPGSMSGWGVFGQRGGGAGNLCPDCLSFIRLVVARRAAAYCEDEPAPLVSARL